MECYWDKPAPAIGICSECFKGVCDKKGCSHIDGTRLFCRNHNETTEQVLMIHKGSGPIRIIGGTRAGTPARKRPNRGRRRPARK